jgi:hypothetical protein
MNLRDSVDLLLVVGAVLCLVAGAEVWSIAAAPPLRPVTHDYNVYVDGNGTTWMNITFCAASWAPGR